MVEVKFIAVAIFVSPGLLFFLYCTLYYVTYCTQLKYSEWAGVIFPVCLCDLVC